MNLTTRSRAEAPAWRCRNAPVAAFYPSRPSAGSRPVLAGDWNLGSSGQNGTPTTTIGPPTAGTFALAEFWRDALGGEWRCTAAGTPGTWIQNRPAAVTADPASGTIPVGYWIWNVTSGHIKRHAGGYVWEVPAA